MSTRVLVTAGNTLTPIDRVRGMTNIFKGRTGIAIAEYFSQRGCAVTLLASYPELVKLQENTALEFWKFRTYDELFATTKRLITDGAFDVVVQSAAISDYRVAGAYRQVGQINERDGHFFVELERLDQAGKISSSHQKLWLETAPTLKIVDQIRKPWGFKGQLVKFKLQVSMGDAELVRLAQKSMADSDADVIVANTLEKFDQAFVIQKDGSCVRVSRVQIPEVLFGVLKL